MGREARSRLAEAAEVDDLPHSRVAGRLAEVPGGEAVLLLERGARRHRVDQVVRRVDARERGVERLPLEAVARDDLGALGDAGGQALRPPGEAPHAVSALRERAQKPATDVAGRARQEDEFGPGALQRIRHAAIVQAGPVLATGPARYALAVNRLRGIPEPVLISALGFRTVRRRRGGAEDSRVDGLPRETPRTALVLAGDAFGAPGTAGGARPPLAGNTGLERAFLSGLAAAGRLLGRNA